MRSFRQYTVAAALALATVAAGSAPAFAGGAGAPDSAYSVYYEHTAQAKPRPHTRAYYDYVAPRHRRSPAFTQDPASTGYGEYSTPAVGGWW